MEPDHWGVPYTLHSLALLAQEVGDYTEADSLFRRTLKIREKILEPDHPELARTLEDYATLLRAMGRPQEAATCEARAAAIRTKHRKDSPAVATSSDSARSPH